MQNAIYPLLLTILINIINISSSYYFVHYLDWGIAGVAYGTVIAQYVGLFVAIILFLYKYRSLLQHFHPRNLLEWQVLSRFLNVNKDIFIRTLSLSLAFAFFYSQSSSIGELTLAANTVLLQFLNWMSFGVDGFAYAAESLVGKYKGAEDQAKTKKAIVLSFLWGMALALLYSLVYMFTGHQLLALFTNQLDVIQIAKTYLIWVIVLPLLGTPCYIWDGIFVGLTATKAMRNSMLLAAACYFIVYYFGIAPWGNHALWLALMSFLIARAIFQTILYMRKGEALT